MSILRASVTTKYTFYSLSTLFNFRFSAPLSRYMFAGYIFVTHKGVGFLVILSETKDLLVCMAVEQRAIPEILHFVQDDAPDNSHV